MEKLAPSAMTVSSQHSHILAETRGSNFVPPCFDSWGDVVAYPFFFLFCCKSVVKALWRRSEFEFRKEKVGNEFPSLDRILNRADSADYVLTVAELKEYIQHIVIFFV